MIFIKRNCNLSKCIPTTNLLYTYSVNEPANCGDWSDNYVLDSMAKQFNLS